MSELTDGEIIKIRNQLHDPTRTKCLIDVQQEIVRLFQNWHDQEGKKYIRFIFPRKEIKTLDSIVFKINNERRKGASGYGADDVKNLGSKDIKDLIGAKILCPYPSDVEVVIDWLFHQNQNFSVEPARETADKEKEERERKTGYRGYHFYLQLTSQFVQAQGLSPGAASENFEVQIKTLLEEAWDAKTHDVTYKREEDIEPDLLDHMKLVSRMLMVMDNQTELLKKQIQEDEEEEERRREAAKILFMDTQLTADAKASLTFPSDKRIEELTRDEIQKISDQAKRQTSNAACCALALLALHTRSPYLEEDALTYASNFVAQAEGIERIERLRIKALTQWALKRTRPALKTIIEVINQTDAIRDKNDYVYYFCDLSRPTTEEREVAEKYIEGLKNAHTPWAEDTLAAFYIRFGESTDIIERGRSHLREAGELIKSKQGRIPMAHAFLELHDYIALRRLLKLRLEGGKKPPVGPTE